MPTLADITNTTEKYQQLMFFPGSVNWRGLPSKLGGSIVADKNILGLCTQYKYVKGKATDIPTITFIVKKKKSRSRLTQGQQFNIPAVLPVFDTKRGRFSSETTIQTDVEESGEIYLCAGGTPGVYVGRKRPVSGGLSVGNARGITTGTLGFWVELDEKGIIGVSNYHVLAEANAQAGDRIVQPGRLDHKGSRNTIGRLLEFFEYNGGGNYVDLACVAPENPADADLFHIEEFGEWKGFTAPVMGMKVAKVGRTSGYTEGEIQAIDASVPASYGNESVRFINQIKMTCKLELGDSGAALIDLKTRKICGLCIATNGKVSYANNIRYIFGPKSVSKWMIKQAAAPSKQPVRPAKRRGSR